MRTLGKTILRVLDGTPQLVRGARQRGQSLMELAFMTPLLVIMIFGIVEVGWLANHYLILLEVTRVGARAGTVLTGDLSALNFPETAVTHPLVQAYRQDTPLDPLGVPTYLEETALNYRNCNVATNFPGFYNFIACTMIDSLDPLTIKTVPKAEVDRQGNVIGSIPMPDDIVISVFAVQAVNNDNPLTWINEPEIYRRTYDFEANPATAGRYPAGFQTLVIGRYPKRANECNTWFVADPGVEVPDAADPPRDAFGNPLGTRDTVEGNDPFDYIRNGVPDFTVVNGRRLWLELDGYDTGPEYQRGFVWTGQKRVTLQDGQRHLICWGSEFTDEEVQRIMNASGFLLPDTGVPPNPATEPDEYAVWQERARYLPSNGVVLVEMHWMHDLLLRFPFFDTFVRMFGDTQRITLSVWAAFPVPAAEPNITFGLAPGT